MTTENTRGLRVGAAITLLFLFGLLCTLTEKHRPKSVGIGAAIERQLR
jgi:hypothetical protein|nr:hypothetical protein [Neorhizobium tomejilense]